MLLERVVTRVLIFTFLMTLTSLLFHEFFQTASDNYHGKALSKENKFVLLNKTLTQLKEDLQIIYKDHLTSMKPVELPTDVSHLVRSVADASETNETTTPIVFIKEGKKSAATPSRIQIPERRALLYTMDSISTYELASKQGGAAGELLIRHSLATIFRELGVHLDVKDTDEGSLYCRLTDCSLLE